MFIRWIPRGFFEFAKFFERGPQKPLFSKQWKLHKRIVKIFVFWPRATKFCSDMNGSNRTGAVKKKLENYRWGALQARLPLSPLGGGESRNPSFHPILMKFRAKWFLCALKTNQKLDFSYALSPPPSNFPNRGRGGGKISFFDRFWWTSEIKGFSVCWIRIWSKFLGRHKGLDENETCVLLVAVILKLRW